MPKYNDSTSIIEATDEDDIDKGYITPIPENTQWQTVGNFFCLKINYIPIINQRYLEHWQMNYVYPVIVSFIIISSYLLYILLEPNYWKIPIWLLITTTIFCILFIVSYAQIILEGPGYLPFYYPIPSTPSLDGSKDHLSGVVCTTRQRNYVKSVSFPQRCKYFKSARRVVIRPDHFCDWCACFIGKKNHKLFYLFNFYGTLYIWLFFAQTVLALKNMIDSKVSGSHIALIIAYIVTAMLFGMFTLMFTISLTYEISINRTEFEKMKKIETTWDTSNILKNWEEVFGASSRWYMWFVPIGAFHGIDEYELIKSNDHSLMEEV